MADRTGGCSDFCNMKQLAVFLPPLDGMLGMLAILTLPPNIKFSESLVPIHTPRYGGQTHYDTCSRVSFHEHNALP